MDQTEKIVTRDTAACLCADARASGKRIGFSSGAFDLLHAGHAEFLEAARKQCDLLIVAVNTDASVRAYKGPERPLVPLEQRMRLLAALQAVDFIFPFDERRNAQNIESLRPDFYFKAGDYAPGQLTSADVVEKHGGKAVLIPIQSATSTSALAERLRGGEAVATQNPEALSLDAPPAKSAPALFVDRDGTINREVEYLHEPEKFELLPGAGEGLRRFQDMGYRIVIVTTQAGIGLGYFTREDFYRVNRAMFRALAPFQVNIDRITFCPHGKGEDCDCRKPATALHRRAARDLNIDLAASVALGDKTADLEAGRRLGCLAIGVRTGHAVADAEFSVQPDYLADSIEDAARWVLQRERASETQAPAKGDDA